MTIDKTNHGNGTNGIYIDYDKQINKMILFMIKNILKYCSQKGLPGNHHFYIKFKTNHPDFLILNLDETPDIELLGKYPNEMTIVLQNSFSDLVVEDKNFNVVLSFNSEPKKLIIPFNSLLTFFDPFANFSVKLDPDKMLNSSNSSLDESLDFFEYDLYEFYEDDYDDENDEISNFFKYDYEKYKLEKDQKIVYFDQLRKKLVSD